MRLLPRFSRSFLLLVIMIITGSWGFLVHRTINQLSIYELPASMGPFFYKHRDYLVYNSPRPDLRRNTDPQEAPRHFIDLELYGSSIPTDWQEVVQRYGMDSLQKMGFVPWHIGWVMQRLTLAFRSGNKDSIIYYAADLGHYVADAVVPLHTTENYDGQLTNQKGLHSLWESMIPELELANYQLSSTHRATYLRQPDRVIWKAVRAASKLVPDMLQKEREVSASFTLDQKYRVQMRNGRESRSYTTAFAKAYAASLGNTVNQQLLVATDLLADCWYTCWVNAGKPDLSALTGSFTAAEQQQYQRELLLFANNQLLTNQALIARSPQYQSGPAN
ncbi:MAG: zinc dependent phospholipase C family protein [Sediminibacterium sp.]